MPRNRTKPNSMSGNKASGGSKAKPDRRVRRTRDALGDALVALMHEKAFSDITVQQVLDRAGVSRSTFYTHYRDKDDLFLSDVEEFLEFMSSYLSRTKESSNRVAPVRELFSHIAEWRQFHAILVESGKIRDFMELCHGYFARAIEQRLSELELGRKLSRSERAATSQMCAGSLCSLMTWWINHACPAPAEEMDRLFHMMVWRGMETASPTASSSSPASSTRRTLRR